VARILLVDDSPITRAMIAKFLQMGGHEVVGEADNLAQALAAYRAQKPDLVTLDLSMGADDGFSVLKALKQTDPEARILIVSANTQRDVFDELVQQGAVGFLTKPFTMADIDGAVAKGLRAVSDAGRKALLGAVAAGAERCAARLSETTAHPWRVVGVELSDESSPFSGALAPVSGDYYGGRLTFMGGSFCVLFSGDSGARVAAAFAREVADRVEGLSQRDALALSEIANITLGPLVEHLAQAWGVAVIPSAPSTRIATCREHLFEALTPYGDQRERLAASFSILLASEPLAGECRVLLFLERVLVDKITGTALL
jgi:two-component system chemotaxis response regulator CheY